MRRGRRRSRLRCRRAVAAFSTRSKAWPCWPRMASRWCAQAVLHRSRGTRCLGRGVVKARSGDMPHQSGHALVALHVDSANAAAALFGTQWARRAEPGAARVHGGGAARPRPRGPRGGGGGGGGGWRESAGGPPRLDSAEVYAALKPLRIAPLRAGVRGEPPLDAAALCAVVIALGRLIAEAPDSIAAIDLDPVLVGARGEGAMVVDALVERR